MPIARRTFLVMLLTVPVAPARLIKRLEKVPSYMFFDMHGNVYPDLESLMIARFDATSEITQAIDRLGHEGRGRELVRALYHVLGFVKDPAPIEWLEAKVARHEPLIFSRWLRNWIAMNGSYGDWEWLEGRERWIAFFERMLAGETDDTRRALLCRVLAGFDDASVVSFFERQQQSTLGHREALEVAAYVSVHGGAVDDQRIKTAADALAVDRANHPFVTEMAYRLRHPAFVPFLISTVVDDQDGVSGPRSLWEAQYALEKITFETSARRKVAWQQWFASHGRDGREAWLARALDSMRRQMRDDETAAAKFFDQAIYNWDDIALLPFVERELMPRSKFRDNIAGWINLTYQSAYRARLEPLARAVAKDAASLAPWARQLLIDRDFLPGKEKITWADYVRQANSAI